MRQHDTLLGSKCLPVPLPDDLSVWENYSGLNAGEAKVSGPHAGHLEVGKVPFYRLNSAKQQSSEPPHSNLPCPHIEKRDDRLMLFLSTTPYS